DIIERLVTDDASYHTDIVANREVRFLHDKLPEKYQRSNKDGRRFYSRLSNNEILRVTAMQTRNPYKFRVPPRGNGKRARDRAQKQTRWGNQLFPAMERAVGKALRRIAVDAQNSDGRAAFLVYLTDAYDNVDFEQAENEADKDYEERLEGDLVEAGPP